MEENLAGAASCKGSTVLVVFHLWARHCRWQMSCQSTLSPHICVIMTWKDLEAGNLWKQWKWMVGDALVHGMRTMHYLVKARHDLFEQTISHQWVPCMYLQFPITKNWWNTKIVSMLASSWDAQIPLSLSWIFHKFLFSWQAHTFDALRLFSAAPLNFLWSSTFMLSPYMELCFLIVSQNDF